MRSSSPLVLLLALAALPALAQGAWSASVHGVYSTSEGVAQVPRGLHGSVGLVAAGYRHFTPAFGLGVEAGYGVFAAGERTYQTVPVCQDPSCGDTNTITTHEDHVHSMLQVSLAVRLRATRGPVRPRVSLSLGAYPMDASGEGTTVWSRPTGEVVRRDAYQLSGNGGGPGVGLTFGVDVLPWGGRHALSAEARLHRVLTGYSGGFYPATLAQIGLGYTFW